MLLIAENWCNKIIFKCVNSAVRPSFNENFGEKNTCESREQCTELGWTQTQLKKEISSIQTFTKYLIVMEIEKRAGHLN